MKKNFRNSLSLLLERTQANKKWSLTIFYILVLSFSNPIQSQIALRGAATTNTSTSTSLTINKPTGVVAGDLMLVNIAKGGNRTIAPSLAGWNLISGVNLGGTGEIQRYGAVLFKIAGANEPGSYAFALGSGTNSASGGIVTFSGVDVVTPFDVTSPPIFVQTSRTSVVATAITTVTPNTAIVMFGQVAGDNPNFTDDSWNTTSPGALTELFDIGQGNNDQSSASAAWAIKPAIGSTGNGTATLSLAERNGGILLALRPSCTANPTIATTGIATSVCFSTSAQTTTLPYTATTNSPTSYTIDWDTAANAAGLADQTTTSHTFVAGAGSMPNIAIRASLATATYNGTLTIITSGGCRNTQAISVTVTPNFGTPNTPTPSATTICQGSANTTYTTSATNATGYTWSVTGAGNTISGTGTTGTVNWATGFTGTATVSVVANGCNGSSASSSTTVTVTPTVGTPNTPTPSSTTICQGTANTTYTTSATNATGYTWSVTGAGNTISGTGTTGTVNWATGFTGTATVSVVANGCNGSSASSSTNVTVTPNNTFGAASSTPTLCVNTALPVDITHTTAGATGIGIPTNLPVGVTATWAPNTIIINGTPATSGTFNYSIPLIGGCGSVSATGTITVTADNTNGVASSTPILCRNTALPAAITHTTTGATGIGTPTNLPAGVSATWASGVITINGTPAESGVFNYSIPLTGGCGNINATGTITIEEPVLAAGNISGTATVCQGENRVRYSVPLIANATGYNWTLPSGATIAEGANTNEIEVNFSTSATSGIIKVSGTNTCPAGIDSADYPLTVNTLPNTAGTIDGNLTVCQGQTNVTYTISPIANATGYIWTVPPGATIVSGNNTNAITLDFTSAVSGNITVQGTNDCGNGFISANFPITVNSLPSVADTITGNSTVCLGQNEVSYSVPAVANATGYFWTVPSGATIVSDDNTNTITVDFSSSAISGNITVFGTNACGNGISSANFSVTINTLPQAAGTISGTPTVCQGQSSVAYAVPAITNATGYTWELPSGASITAGTNTNAITVAFSTSAVSGNITVKGTNDCGNGVISANYPVTVNLIPTDAGSISGPAIVCQGQSGIVYSVPQIANALNYVWTLPSGATITSGNNTNRITVSYSETATSGIISVKGTNACGDGIIANYVVTVSITPSIGLNYSSTVCSEELVTVLPTNGGENIVPPGTTYSWGLPTTSGGITGATSQTGQASFSQTLTNTTSSQQTATYLVTAATNGCSSSTFTITVYVNPRPTVAVSPVSLLPFCSGGTINLTPTNPNSVLGSIDYNWSRNIITGVTGLTSGTGIISGALTNTTNAPQTVTFTITATSDAGCTSIAPATVNVTINPIPTLNITDNTQTICSDAAITTIGLTPAPNNVPGTTFSWNGGNNPNITGISAGSGTSIPGTLVNSTNTIQTTTYSITASANGCNSVVGTATITVKQKPTITANPTTQEICGGSPITTIVPSSNLGNIFTWTSSNPAAGILNGSGIEISGILNNSTNSNITVNFSITTIYDGCTSNPVVIPVSVKPQPIINISNNAQNICNGNAMAGMTISTTNIPVLTGTNYSWTRTNSNVTGTGTTNLAGTNYTTNPISAGTLTNISGSTTTQTAIFTVTATNNGCSKTAAASVTVYVPLIQPLISSSQSVCLGSFPSILTIDNLASVGGSGNYTYQWQRSNDGVNNWNPAPNVNNTSTYQPGRIPLGGGQNYYYRVRIIDTCGTVFSDPVFIQVVSNAGFDFTVEDGLNGPLCPGSTFRPSLEAVHSENSAVRYSWSADSNYITQSTGGPTGTTGARFWIFVWLRISRGNIGPLTVQNNTNATVTTQLEVTPSVYNYAGNNPQPRDFSCSISPQYIPVQIRPTPRVASITTPSSTICSGNSTSINVQGNITDAPMFFDWQIVGSLPTGVTVNGDTSGPSPRISHLPSPGVFNLAVTLNNTSTITQAVTFRFTPRSDYSSVNCAGVFSDIVINVAPAVAGILTNDQFICSNDTPTQLTLSSTTGLSLSLLWQSSTDGTNFTTIAPSQTGLTYNPPALTQSNWYRVRLNSAATGSLTCTAFSNIVKITVNSITPGTISSSQTVCAPTSSAIALTGTVATVPVANTGSAITYQWESSIADCNNGFNPITNDDIANLNFSIPAGLNTTTYFRRKATSTLNGLTCSQYSNCIVITPNIVTAGTLSMNQTICQNEVPTQLTLSGSTAGATYQWERSTTGCSGTWSTIPNANNSTFTPPTLTTTTCYRVSVTASFNSVACTVYSNCITITVNPTVNAGIIGSNKTICSGSDTPIVFTGTTISGVTYQWQNSANGVNFNNIASATNPTYVENGSITQTTYYRRVATATVNGSNCSAPSNFVTVFVNTVTAPTIAGDQNITETPGNPAAFTNTTPATGSGTLSYQWQSSTVGCEGPWANISGATSATYAASGALTTTYYRVVVTSTLNNFMCTAISNCLTIVNLRKTWTGLVNTDWNVDGNWQPNGIPTSNDYVVIPDVVNDPEIMGSNYDAYAKSLSILGGAELELSSNNAITVIDAINVDATGSFEIENNASLVQINNVPNIGKVKIERITQPMYRFDYTYWGSPVTAASGFTLGMLSPETLIDKYFSWTPSVSGSFGSWFFETRATVMDPRKGYIVRAPQPFSPNAGTKVPYTANFIGTPNNGDISAPIFRGTLDDSPNDDWNLLGNPYPSALDAEKFLSDDANKTIIDGTIYFWTHKSPPSANNIDPFYGDFVINYSADDYASWNRLGGTGTTAAAVSGSATPGGFIASGQAFFTKSIGAASGNSVLFKNTMRVNFKNDQFFRNSIVAATNSRATENEKHRIWLNLVSTGGSFNQILVGYHNEATNGLDRDFDGVRVSDNNSFTFHSKLTDKNLVIQGRALPFSDQDQVPLGYKSAVNETFSIRIDHIDGLFENQNIYIEDRLLQNIHDLKQSPYVFTSGIGSFDDRFVLRYSNGFLGTSSLTNESEVSASLRNEKLVIYGGEVLSEVSLYDISGKLILTEVLERPTTNFETAFHGAEGVYIAKIKFQNGKFATKKLIQKK